MTIEGNTNGKGERDSTEAMEVGKSACAIADEVVHRLFADTTG